MIPCQHCGKLIPDGEYINHVDICRTMLCIDCGQQIPLKYFVEHRQEHGKDAARKMGVKIPDDENYEKEKYTEIKEAAVEHVVDKLDEFYETELNASREELPLISGVQIIPYEQDLLLGEIETALGEPSLMPTGMTDPIDFALSNYVTIIWSDTQQFMGFVDKKPGYQTNRFPTGNYSRDYYMVKELLKKRDPTLYGEYVNKFDNPQFWKKAKEWTEVEPVVKIDYKKTIDNVNRDRKPDEPQYRYTKTRKRHTLPELNKKAINKILGEISTGNKYYDAVPLATIFQAIRDNDGIVLQEDWTEYTGIITGDDGRATWDIGEPATKYNEKGLDIYEPYKNTMLVLTWHRMGTGRYEVVAYLS